MEITIKREPSISARTHGELFIDGQRHCSTLEDEIREDPDPSTPHNEAKVYGKTAIPPGRYRVSLVNSGRFGPGTIAINDVPGFEHIRIHGGNTVEHTLGCPLVGMRRSSVGIHDCKAALDPLKRGVAMAIVQERDVWIEIVNP